MSAPLPEGFDPGGAASSQFHELFGLPTSVQDAKVVVIPVPFEATVSYGDGTINGPEAVRDASVQVDLFHAQTGKPYERGIAMLPIPDEVKDWSNDARRLAADVLEAGGADSQALRLKAQAVNMICSGMNQWVYARSKEHLDAGQVPVVLGGDHSVPFGAFQAYAEKYPGMGILHIDAHYDLREAYEGFTWSHASIMRNALDRIPDIANIVHVGIRDYSEDEMLYSKTQRQRSVTYFELDIRDRLACGQLWRELTDEIVDHLPPLVYVSFDIDGLDPALCPGTGTPVPGGLSYYEAVSLLEAVVRSGRTIIGADLCEVAPSDGDREWNANVGSRILYTLIGFAVKSQN